GGGGGGGAQGSGGSRPPRPLSYLLQNLDTGFALRGKTQTGASLGSLVFAPHTYYGLFFVDDLTGATTVSFFKSAGPGETTKVPCSMWLNGGLPLMDTDGDGLPDLAERAAGTSLISGDSDGDGRSDRLELADGTNPLDGLALPNGLVGSADVPNSGILTVAAEGSLLYAGGVEMALSVFDLSQPRQPLRVGTLDLPGQNFSRALSVHGGFAAAGGTSGLALMDVRDPANPALIAQVPLSNITSLACRENDVVVLAGSSLYLFDRATGLQQLVVALPEAGHDVQVYGDFVYVLTSARLIVYRQVDFLLLETGRVAVGGGIAPLEVGRKLFVGGGRAYVGTFTGFSVVDVSDPAKLTVLGTPPSTQAAIHDLAANDAGLLLPVVSFGGTSTLAVGAYDVRDPADVTRFLTSWSTPGDTRALTLHQGLAYVADTVGDVQVLNYLAPDLAGVPPTLSFTANFPLAPARAEFDALLRLLVEARDDVQVREVTAFVDDLPVSGDGSFPFQLEFGAPTQNSGRTNFTLQLRAIDTAGNTRWSDPLVVELVEDRRPPRLVGTFPIAGGRTDNFGLTDLLVEFDQPLAVDSITTNTLTVVGAGADRLFDTADDVPRFGVANPGTDPKWLEWEGTNQFPVGLFRVTLAAGLRGTNDVPRSEPVSWTFETVAIRPRLAATTPSGTSATPFDGVAEIEARLDLATTAQRATNAVFTLREAGPDRVRGTIDDRSVLLSSVQFDVGSGHFRLTPSVPLLAGLYRVALSGSGFSVSQADFELRPVPNVWANPAGGRWNVASNWSGGVPLANDFLRIPRLVPGLITTNGTLPALNRIESEADFVQETGVFTLTGDGFFDGQSWFLGSDLGGPSLGGGGTLINRGTMQIGGGSTFVNRSIVLEDITIANRGKLEWVVGQLSFADPTALIFNEPSGIFDLGAKATRTLVGTSSTGQRGRIVNAGLLRKVADTNVTTLRTVTLENSGRILVGAGQLDVGDVTGPGEIEIQSGASIAFNRFLQLPADARIHGGGDFSIVGGSSNAPQVLLYRHELTGVATAEANFIDIRRAFSHPGIQFQSRNGWFRFYAPLNAHRIWNFKGSFGGIQLNAPTTTEILQLDQGILSGPAAIAVTRNLLWTDGKIEAGGEITVHERGEIRGSGILTQRQIRILPGAVVIGVSNAFLTTSVRGLEGRIVNEGTFIKRGAGRMTIRTKLENRGLLRFEEGQLLVERQPQGDGQFFPVTGELQFAGGELALYLQSFNGATLTQTNGLISGFGRIINVGGGFGNKVENRTLVRLNVPGKALEIVTMNYQQNASGELEVTLGAAGCGQLVGDPGWSLILAGRLRVVLEPGFVPEVGQSFVICQGRRSGTFGEVILPDLGPGRKLELTYSADQAVVTVLAGP
ncbi:MAG: hypothetical protein J0M24_27375, partial [Verrucomicrobia bacterium]|nr:hypothetical protein [Verrucomicrobiota bacterium]